LLLKAGKSGQRLYLPRAAAFFGICNPVNNVIFLIIISTSAGKPEKSAAEAAVFSLKFFRGPPDINFAIDGSEILALCHNDSSFRRVAA
jgi:hypothetical protein